jgi:phosphoglycerate dehydrogenase-like enzyme
MAKLNIAVWDNIGNTMLGMRGWDEWDQGTQDRLLAEDPNGRSRIITIPELLKDHDVDIVWLYDEKKYLRGFRTFFEEHPDQLRPVNGPDDLINALRDADFAIIHKEMLPPAALESAEKLRLIQHLGRDARGLPIEVARRKGIPAVATPLVNYSAVAEQVWATILVHLKRLNDQRVYMDSGEYIDGWGAYHPKAQIVSDLTLGLLGMGEIARPLARYAQAFRMKTLYWDIVRFPDLEAELDLTFVEWNDLWAQSDIVSVQLALNEKTQGMIGAAEFAKMKPAALFTNSARGKLVDQSALVAALQENRIGGAALDVYEEEPLPLDSPLHALARADPDRVILTPHSAAQGPWTWIRDSQDLWFNIRRVLDGQEPLYQI